MDKSLIDVHGKIQYCTVNALSVVQMTILSVTFYTSLKGYEKYELNDRLISSEVA